MDFGDGGVALDESDGDFWKSDVPFCAGAVAFQDGDGGAGVGAGAFAKSASVFSKSPAGNKIFRHKAGLTFMPEDIFDVVNERDAA